MSEKHAEDMNALASAILNETGYILVTFKDSNCKPGEIGIGVKVTAEGMEPMLALTVAQILVDKLKNAVV